MSSSAIQLAPSRYRDSAEVTKYLRPEDPVYLFSTDALQKRANAFLTHFPGSVSYAVKANPEARVIDTLSKAGIRHFDVASIEEVRLISQLCPDAEMHFNNPIKADHAIAEAWRSHGVRSFVIDEARELEKVRRLTESDPNVVYTVRFTLDHAGAVYDFGSKFGAARSQAVELLRHLKKLGAHTAITFHPGSQCTDADRYDLYLEAAAYTIAESGTQPRFVNVGGGFPEYYLGTDLPVLTRYFDVISNAMRNYFETTLPLICEPGRGMVGSCASLLTRVVHVRSCQETLFINDGIYGGLQEQTLVKLDLPVRVWRQGQPVHGPMQRFTVFGPTCDPFDKLPRPIELPRDIEAGDYIEFGLLGAYGSATTTRFNGFESSAYIDVAELTPWWLKSV